MLRAKSGYTGVLLACLVVLSTAVAAADTRYGVLVLGPVQERGDKVLARSVGQMYEFLVNTLAIPRDQVIVIADSTSTISGKQRGDKSLGKGKSSSQKLLNLKGPHAAQTTNRRGNADVNSDVLGGAFDVDYNGADLNADTIVSVVTGRTPRCRETANTRCSRRVVPDGATVVFYFNGHGARNDGVLLTNNARLRRADVERMVANKGSRRLLLMFDACFSEQMVNFMTSASDNVVGVASSAVDKGTRKGIESSEIAFRWIWLAHHVQGQCGASKATSICEAKCTLTQYVARMGRLKKPDVDNGRLEGLEVRAAGLKQYGSRTMLDTEVRRLVCSPAQVRTGRVSKSVLPAFLAKMFKK